MQFVKTISTTDTTMRGQEQHQEPERSSEVRDNVLQETRAPKASHRANERKGSVKDFIAAPASMKAPTAVLSPQKARAESTARSTSSDQVNLRSALQHWKPWEGSEVTDSFLQETHVPRPSRRTNEEEDHVKDFIAEPATMKTPTADPPPRKASAESSARSTSSSQPNLINVLRHQDIEEVSDDRGHAPWGCTNPGHPITPKNANSMLRASSTRRGAQWHRPHLPRHERRPRSHLLSMPC